MRVAVIDDELYALKHMERLLCEVEEESPLCYSNPQRALRELPAKKPDILFVDIMMPVMTGLEFAAEYLKICPFATVIILTSYRDFDFAKKSVEIGVYEYWLKNELRVGSFQEKWEKLLAGVQKAGRAREQAERELVSLVLTGKAGVAALFSPQEDSRYFLVAADMENSVGFLDVLEHSCFVAGMGENSGWHFCVGRFKNLDSGIWDELKNLVAPSLKGGHAVISAPFLAESGWGEIQRFFVILGNYHLGGAAACFPDTAHPELYAQGPQMTKMLDADCFRGLDVKIKERDKEGVYACLRRVWENPILRGGNRAALRHCLSRLRAIAALIAPNDRPVGVLDRLCEEFEGLSLSKLQKSAMQAFDGLLSSWNSGLQYRSPLINQAVKYIQNHYKEDLHVSAIAERLALSPDYLRKLFKSETGVGITDYITETRMSVANSLLETGQYKIYEIADLTGYNSAAYFSQTYFKRFGRYPTERGKLR